MTTTIPFRIVEPDFFEALMQDGGITVENARLAFHKNGYQYCLKDGEIRISTSEICWNEPFQERRNRICNAFKEATKGMLSYGAWLSGDYLYIDPTSTFTTSLERACRLMIENGQQAIYDWTKKADIHQSVCRGIVAAYDIIIPYLNTPTYSIIL